MVQPSSQTLTLVTAEQNILFLFLLHWEKQRLKSRFATPERIYKKTSSVLTLSNFFIFYQTTTLLILSQKVTFFSYSEFRHRHTDIFICLYIYLYVDTNRDITHARIYAFEDESLEHNEIFQSLIPIQLIFVRFYFIFSLLLDFWTFSPSERSPECSTRN